MIRNYALSVIYNTKHEWSLRMGLFINGDDKMGGHKSCADSWIPGPWNPLQENDMVAGCAPVMSFEDIWSKIWHSQLHN